MDVESAPTDMESVTPETKYFKMMMEDNQIGRVTYNDNADNDSVIGGQTIASLMNDGSNAGGARDFNTAESYSQSNDANQSTISIVGYDDVSTIANDTVNDSTKVFFTGNGDREDSKPRIRLFKEYNKEYKKFKTPEKKMRSGDQIEDDNETQPETPPGVIQVPSSHSRSYNKNKGSIMAGERGESCFLLSRRVYIIAGVLALILFVSIIALAAALKDVRGDGTSESSSSYIDSYPGNSGDRNGNAILDLWPDLDMTISNNDKGSVTEDGIEIPSVTEPIDKKPVAATLEPTLLLATPDPTSEPTADLATQSMFDETVNLLTERGALSWKVEIESNQDSPQYYATTWLSQDPNYFGYTSDRLVQRWSLAMLALSLDSATVAENPLRLRRLQDKVGSDLLQGWLTYTDECTWFTSSTKESFCNQNGMYETIDLQDMMLGGTLPSEIALLSNSLQHIILDGNELTGSIPNELEELTNLVSLRLRRNALEKKLSIDFGQLNSLEILDLGRNKLTGFIPYNVLYLNSLTEIYLDYNNLSGNIPWGIGDLTFLTTLALGDNNLSGWIPSSLVELVNLEILTLGNNELTGDLPKGICLFGNLEVLSADCVEQGCECCTECASTDSPSSSPTTVPSTSPSASLSASPTNSPSSSPIVQIPSSSPTVCVDEISILDFCFAPLADIGVSLTNCNSRRDDWVGVYRVSDNFDINALTNPSMWSWACGTRNCMEAVGQKTIPLNDIHAGNDEWPLEPGIYVAILARNTVQPYTAVAASETFVVASQC